jgi:predicted porin
MQVKRITLICAALFAAPAAAFAQTAVEIYGRLNADLESVKATGSATGTNFSSRSRVTSNSSNVGVRGTEELGQGLRAFFQIESAVNFDSGTQSGFWASRNSGIGLISGYGQLLIGQWDSPYKFATVRIDPTGDTGIASYTGIIGSTGSVTAGQGFRAASPTAPATPTSAPRAPASPRAPACGRRSMPAASSTNWGRFTPPWPMSATRTSSR